MANTKKPVRRRKAATLTKAPTKPVTLTKAAMAKKKVDELLEGISSTSETKEEVVVDKIVEATKDKDVEYLKKQIEGLTEQNTKLSEDYTKLLNEFKLKGGEPTGDDSNLKKGIEAIFFDLDGALTGKKYGKVYPEANIRVLLNKFMSTFPFLGEALKKRNTITQKPRGQGQQKIASGPTNMHQFR